MPNCWLFADVWLIGWALLLRSFRCKNYNFSSIYVVQWRMGAESIIINLKIAAYWPDWCHARRGERFVRLHSVISSGGSWIYQIVYKLKPMLPITTFPPLFTGCWWIFWHIFILFGQIMRFLKQKYFAAEKYHVKGHFFSQINYKNFE